MSAELHTAKRAALALALSLNKSAELAELEEAELRRLWPACTRNEPGSPKGQPGDGDQEV